MQDCLKSIHKHSLLFLPAHRACFIAVQPSVYAFLMKSVPTLQKRICFLAKTNSAHFMLVRFEVGVGIDDVHVGATGPKRLSGMLLLLLFLTRKLPVNKYLFTTLYITRIRTSITRISSNTPLITRYIITSLLNSKQNTWYVIINNRLEPLTTFYSAIIISLKLSSFLNPTGSR